MRVLKRRRDKIGPEPERPRSSYLDWNYDAELYAFGPRLNETFKPELLQRALTHKSYKNEGKSTEDNEELIRNGEKLINTCINEYLKVNVSKLPDDARNAIKNYLTSESTLAHIGKHIGLKDIILCNVRTIWTSYI